MNNNAKEIFWKKKSTLLAIFFAIFICIAIGIYSAGYRFTDNFGLAKEGFVSLKIPLAGTAIFIDESEKIITSKDNELVQLSFSPRTHSVIVAREGYFPWKKDFVVPSEAVLELYPLFAAQNASGMIITSLDPEYTKIKNSIVKHLPPTKENPLISSDKSALLWLEDNAILVKANSTTSEAVLVAQPDTIIKNVDFYKNRSDVVVFSTNNSVYAIEVNKEGGQNFLPLYKGQAPNFITASPTSLYVLDGENLMEVII